MTVSSHEVMMTTKGKLDKAFGYQGDNMNLPVRDVAAALPFYETVLGFQVAAKSDAPHKSAVLERDDIRIGLVENGGDPTQDGCAFHVTGLETLAAEFKSRRLQTLSDFKTEMRGGKPWNVFFVVAPDGLCYWFGEQASAEPE